MTKRMRLAAGLIAACSFATVTPALAAPAPAAATTPAPPADNAPEGGVTIMATFSMQAYTYGTYRKALTMEIPLMAKNGVKLLHSYRVLIGGMDKYFDIWWAPDYETAYNAFYNPKYTDPKFEEFLASTTGALINPTIEIVQDEKF